MPTSISNHHQITHDTLHQSPNDHPQWRSPNALNFENNHLSAKDNLRLLACRHDHYIHSAFTAPQEKGDRP